jgi:hypothetical protein
MEMVKTHFVGIALILFDVSIVLSNTYQLIKVIH